VLDHLLLLLLSLMQAYAALYGIWLMQWMVAQVGLSGRLPGAAAAAAGRRQQQQKGGGSSGSSGGGGGSGCVLSQKLADTVWVR
jgi:hypothetical protein